MSKFSYYLNFFLISSLLMGIFISCEEELIPETIDADQQYIVEGYIQTSNEPAPTYVIMTRSIPFFSEVSQATLNEIFVKNAIVSVNDGNKIVQLTHFCLDDLPDNIKPLIKSSLGLDSINGAFNFCAYVDIMNEIETQEEATYELNIEVEDHQISAITTIPPFVPIDTIWTQETPGTPLDSFSQLYCRINDPLGENFYRYKNGYKGQAIIAPQVSSIADFLFDGKDFKFPMDRAFSDFDINDHQTVTYFKIGDSIQVDWICIDKDQYNFWNTLELDRVQQGPFSSYIRAKSNVKGALGVWSGMSSRTYVIPN